MGNINFKHISFQFGQQIIFEDANIYLKENHVHFLVGGSGVGKTTLLNILSKRLFSKTVSNIDFWNNEKAEDISKELICYQLINHGFLQNLTVKENIKEVKNMYLSENINENELIELFQFEKLMDLYPNQLSGGQKRLLSIILALLKNRPILFLDEPTSSLDESIKAKLLNYLKKYARMGHTVLLATNDFNIFSYADILIEVKNKKIIQINDHEEKQSRIEINKNSFKISLRSIYKQRLWHKLILIALIISISILYGNSLRTLSEANYFHQNKLYELNHTYLNTAYVYQETLLQSDHYHTFAPVLSNELKPQLENNKHIKTIYPYYCIPLGSLMSGKLNDNNDEMYLYLNSDVNIDLTSENYPFLEFYFPEQIEGNDIYISQQFLNMFELSLEDVSSIQIDAAIPFSSVEGDIVQLIKGNDGQDIEIPIESIYQIYQKDTLSFNIDNSHHVRSEMYNVSASPLLYVPYSMIDELIDTEKAVVNAFVLILEEGTDVEQLRDDIYQIDEKLIFSYPAKTNATYLAQSEEWVKSEWKRHIGITFLCVCMISLFYILLESLNKNDYYYLTYSGFSDKNYFFHRFSLQVILLLLIIALAHVYMMIFGTVQPSYKVILLSHVSIVVFVICCNCALLNMLFSHWNKKIVN